MSSGQTLHRMSIICKDLPLAQTVCNNSFDRSIYLAHADSFKRCDGSVATSTNISPTSLPQNVGYRLTMPSKTFAAFISNLYQRCARGRTHLTQKLIPLNIHLVRIGEATSPICLKCNPNAETACFFVDQFPAYQQGKRTLEVQMQNRSPQNEMGAPYQCYWRALLTLSAF